MSGETRIRPVDPDTAEGELQEIVAGNRKKWGKPLLPYLMYARSREKHIRRAVDAWETLTALDHPHKRPGEMP